MTETTESVKVDALARKINQKYASSQVLNLEVTGTATGNVTLGANGSANDNVLFTATLSNKYGLVLFAFENWTLYQSSVDSANIIREGSSVDRDDYEVDVRTDWGSTDNANVKLKVFVLNKSAGSKSVIIKVNFRFIIETTAIG